MRKFFLFICCSLISIHLFAQTGFTKFFSFSKFSTADRVIQTSDSGFMVCGSTRDTSNTFFWKIFLLKLDKNGDSLWSKVYGPFSAPKIIGIVQFQSGEFVIGFDTHVSGYDNYLNFLKTDESGDSLFYVPADTTFLGGKMRMGKSENIYVSGSRGWYDYYWNFYSIPLLRKYDKNLQLMWETQLKTDQSGSPSYANDLLLDNFERITVSGNFTVAPFGPIINELDSSGTVTWYINGSDIASLGCIGTEVIIGETNGGIIFSTGVPYSSNRLLTNLDSLHSLLWQQDLYFHPVFFHQWDNKKISMVDYNFRVMNISESGDSIDLNDDYALDSSSTSDVARCFDETLIAVGNNCWYCTNHREAYVVKFQPSVVGIEEIHSNSEYAAIHTFPNPSGKNIALSFSSAVNNICLFSTSGKLLQEFGGFHKSKFDLDVSNLSSGMYFISATSGDNTYRGKILVVH
ncbi:MAG TPA: T9SS type A sorting domain-containing protein [Chitinophagales bacterium]|nr:T9SS type A sorting domain-containing protein [Chitinophagales bacterium]